jgi:hypothetical protein
MTECIIRSGKSREPSTIATPIRSLPRKFQIKIMSNFLVLFF